MRGLDLQTPIDEKNEEDKKLGLEANPWYTKSWIAGQRYRARRLHVPFWKFARGKHPSNQDPL
jgi:hypothetical protein